VFHSSRKKRYLSLVFSFERLQGLCDTNAESWVQDNGRQRRTDAGFYRDKISEILRAGVDEHSPETDRQLTAGSSCPHAVHMSSYLFMNCLFIVHIFHCL
jgi:hypothetical protein